MVYKVFAKFTTVTSSVNSLVNGLLTRVARIIHPQGIILANHNNSFTLCILHKLVTIADKVTIANKSHAVIPAVHHRWAMASTAYAEGNIFHLGIEPLNTNPQITTG